MKINNTSIFMGDTTRRQRDYIQASDENKGGGAIFAGDLNARIDPIAQKKQKAKEQAMKIVGDAFDGDRKIDEEIQERRNKIAQLKADIGKANAEVNDMEKRREQLGEEYGIAQDSEEERALTLLEKEADAKIPWKKVSLSKAEREEIARIKADGLTEYQQRSMEMKEYCTYYEKRIYEMETEIKAEDAVIRSTRLERLKSDPMVKANKQADAVMEAAGEEVVSMLMDEAKEHIDEEMEEKKEAAEKKAEEKEALEEKLEKAKEKRKEQAELTEVITESTQQIVELDNVKSDVQDEVQKVLNKMKLLEEDIKGAAVDEVL